MTAKRTNKERNPFIPTHSPVCRMADTLMLFGIALAGVSAALIVLIKYFGDMP